MCRLNKSWFVRSFHVLRRGVEMLSGSCFVLSFPPHVCPSPEKGTQRGKSCRADALLYIYTKYIFFELK